MYMTLLYVFSFVCWDLPDASGLTLCEVQVFAVQLILCNIHYTLQTLMLYILEISVAHLGNQCLPSEGLFMVTHR